MDVVCVGSATIDVFVLLHELQKFTYDKFSNQISFPLGEKIPLDEYKLALGGNACNVSVGLSRLGMNSNLAAEIGEDEFAEKIKNGLTLEKVGLDLLSTNSAKNSHFNVVLSFEGERTVLEEKTPANQSLNPGKLNPAMIYLTSLTGDFEKAYEDAFANNPDSKFGLNPSPRQINDKRDAILKFLDRIDVLFVNLGEAQALTGSNDTDVKNVLSHLRNLGPKNCVITDGRNGSYAIDQNNRAYHISSATEDKPVERTGAGDAYAAAFLFSYLSNKEIDECMRAGAVNADSVITKIGAQEGLLNSGQMNEMLEKMPEFRAKEI